MGNALSSDDNIPLLVTLVDVHVAKSQEMFYFANVSVGGDVSKVVGRSQTLSAEVSLHTVVTMVIYESTEPRFSEMAARCIGQVRFPVQRLAERYPSGLFQQWVNLDTHTDPRAPPPGDSRQLAAAFESAYQDGVSDVYAPKVCVTILGSSFEVQRSGRNACSIFVGEEIKTDAGPDVKALMASHRQQASYIDSLHEELRRLNTPNYRPLQQQ